jgi:kinesin family protein 3/17
MSSETVKVMVRCRPMNTNENNIGCKKIVSINKSVNQISLFKTDKSNCVIPPKSFTFDSV